MRSSKPGCSVRLAERSAPAQNASSPAPVNTMARTDLSEATRGHNAASPSSTSRLSALRRAGLLMVTTRTPCPECSTSMATIFAFPLVRGSQVREVSVAPKRRQSKARRIVLAAAERPLRRVAGAGNSRSCDAARSRQYSCPSGSHPESESSLGRPQMSQLTKPPFSMVGIDHVVFLVDDLARATALVCARFWAASRATPIRSSAWSRSGAAPR